MRTAKCSCGAEIEEVLDTPPSAGKFWQRSGTCEVCVNNHWHEPAPECPQDASEELGNAEGSPYEQKSQQDPSEVEEHWKEYQSEQKYSEGE